MCASLQRGVSLTSKAALEQASRLARDMALLAAQYRADDQRRAYSTELRLLLEQAEIEVPV